MAAPVLAADKDGPEDSPTQAASAAAASVLRRDAGDLAEVMRRRRISCEEYESVPSSSTADFAAPAQAAGPEAQVDSENGASAEVSPSSAVEDSGPAAGGDSPQDEEGLTQSQRRDATAPKKSRHTSDIELQRWMDQMRGRCQVLESEQASASGADAQSEGVQAPRAAVLEAAEVHEATRIPFSNKSTSQLQDWMAKMRARCEILESTPGTTTADAKSENPRFEGSTPAAAPPSTPGDGGPGPPAAVSSAETPAAAEEVQATPASAELLVWRLQLRDGTSMSAAERLQVWPALLLRDPAAKPSALEFAGIGKALPAIAHLLGGSGGAGVGDDEEVLFDTTAESCESPSKGLCHRLAVAFSQKYVSPLAGQATTSDDAFNAPVYSALAQLLRYHYPATACAIEAITVNAGFTLAEVLGVIFGGPAGLAQCLLTPHGGGEADALLQLCDLVVMEEEVMLLLHIAVVLLGEVRPEPGTSYEDVKELIQGKRGLGGLGSRGVSGVCQCVAAARALLEATPVSVSNALAAGDRAAARLRQPMCAVAPDEALHHIYERPPGSWRLVVVDVRMRASQRALPVCLRLGQSAHNQRRQMLRDLPYEECIHLCLLGDGLTLPGDDAYELCRHLVSPNVMRKHVSVVDGGWPAVEELADSLRLHLMPLDAEEEPVVARSSLKDARAAVAEVAGQVASATETATAVGQKVAQKVLKGARGAALSLLGGEPWKSGSTAPAVPTACEAEGSATAK